MLYASLQVKIGILYNPEYNCFLAAPGSYLGHTLTSMISFLENMRQSFVLFVLILYRPNHVRVVKGKHYNWPPRNRQLCPDLGFFLPISPWSLFKGTEAGMSLKLISVGSSYTHIGWIITPTCMVMGQSSHIS